MAAEFKSIIDLITTFKAEQDCINHLEQIRWNGNVVSPFDPTSKIYKCAGNKYKCKNTGKYFNVKTDTIFEDTKIPLLKWFMALYVFSSHKKGISSHQLAKDISVTQKSAWFMLHRLRFVFDIPVFNEPLSGDIEIDETFMGRDDKNKHSNKKVEGNRGRSHKVKTPVLGMIERQGNIIAKVVENTKQMTVEPIIFDSVKEGSNVFTDEWSAYNKLNRMYNHGRVNHGAKEYVNLMAHTNSLEGFWSHLKRGVDDLPLGKQKALASICK